MLIAERLLLLLDAAGTGGQAGRATLGEALSAAVVGDLALSGAVTYDEDSELLSASDPPRDPVLVPAFDLVRERPLPLALVVTRLSRQPLQKELQARTATHLPEHAQRSLAPVLLKGKEADEETAAVITLLAALELAARVVDHPDHSSKDITARAQEVADGDWGNARARAIVRAAADAAVDPPTNAAMGAGLGG